MLKETNKMLEEQLAGSKRRSGTDRDHDNFLLQVRGGAWAGERLEKGAGRPGEAAVREEGRQEQDEGAPEGEHSAQPVPEELAVRLPVTRGKLG